MLHNNRPMRFLGSISRVIFETVQLNLCFGTFRPNLFIRHFHRRLWWKIKSRRNPALIPTRHHKYHIPGFDSRGIINLLFLFFREGVVCLVVFGAWCAAHAFRSDKRPAAAQTSKRKRNGCELNQSRKISKRLCSSTPQNKPYKKSRCRRS